MKLEISCKELSQKILDRTKEKIIKNNYNLTTVIFQTGENSASDRYVRNKIKKLEYCGINCILKKYPNIDNPLDLMCDILLANFNKKTTGIILQYPLLKNISSFEKIYLKSISPYKDLDCLTNEIQGNIYTNESNILPATAQGIIYYLEELYEGLENIKGKNILVIGRSKIVGKPLAIKLINLGATVTVANSYTKNLHYLVESNEIIISAVGKENLITTDMVNNNHILIDVGININSEGKLVGDINRECKNIVRHQTPVPNGVGLLTTACICENVVKLFENLNER